MSELYLIAHKVRGKPAFDIAHKLQIGDEEGWIIPTSGHRAWPYWWEKLSFFLKPNTYYEGELTTWKYLPNAYGYMFPDIPPGWPDHYSANPTPTQPLAARLGITPAAAPKVQRRV